MQVPTRFLSVALALSPLIAVVGCEVEPVGPPDCVAVVEPGYYYDEAYVDVGGVRHPRDYWYHDGHAWAHRDNVPHGFAARDRSTVGYVHGNAPHGGPAGGGGGDHGGGGGHGGR